MVLLSSYTYRSFPELRLPGSVAEGMVRSCKMHKDRVAIMDAPQSLSWTYDDVLKQAEASGDLLSSFSVAKVLLVSSGSIAFASLLMGIWFRKGTAILAHPQEVKFLGKGAGAEFVITEMKHRSKVAFLELPTLLVDESGDPVALERLSVRRADRPDQSNRLLMPEIGNPALGLFSSGTTGKLPKCIFLSHANQLARLQSVALHRQGEGEEGVHMLAMSMAHAFGFGVLMNTLFRGHTLILDASSEALARSWETLSEFCVTDYYALPTMIRASLPQLPAARALPSLKRLIYGGGRLGAQERSVLVEMLRTKGDIHLVSQYGMTETGQISMADSNTPLDSVGMLLPGITAQIVDSTSGRSLAPYEKGELFIAGPGVVLQGNGTGYLATGDIAYFDEPGNLFIVGRFKDVIKVKGRQVPLNQLEDIVSSCPGVLESSIMGVEDDKYGEVPVAFVVGEIEETELLRFVASKVPSYMVIHKVIKLTTLPRTLTGKVKKEELKKLC